MGRVYPDSYDYPPSERWRYIRYEDGAEELYDHCTDPNEWRNLTSGSENINVIEGLLKHLPAEDALTDVNTNGGWRYYQYFLDVIERTRSDR